MITELNDKLKGCKTHGMPRDVNGAYVIKHGSTHLCVIASNGMGWNHVSVSLPTRCPTWSEMCFIKGLFFGPDEVVMQLHPAQSEYVNNHPFCLHLWQPQLPNEIPVPPSELVGFKRLGVLAT